MSQPAIADITAAIERFAPPTLQEDYDNSGLIIGRGDTTCTGVLATFDVTIETVREAVERDCNLIVAHHPLIFKGLRRLNGANPVEAAVIEAVRCGVAIYAAHTSIDNAPGGVSWLMANRLGLRDTKVLDPLPDGRCGAGTIGNLSTPMSIGAFGALVKEAFGCRVLRYSDYPGWVLINRVALCGGAGSSLADKAMAQGAQAFVTADVKYHEFADYSGRLLLVDAGHFETEHCITSLFRDIITEIFPNFAVWCATTTHNPVNYM